MSARASYALRDARGDAPVVIEVDELVSHYGERRILNGVSLSVREGEILVMAEDGMSRQQIESELVSRFPDIQGYLGRPELIYGTALAALIAITMLLIAARRWTRRTAPAQAPSAKVPPPDASEMDRLDDALDRIEGF